MSAEQWAEFQLYLRQVEDADPDFLAYAAGATSSVGEQSGADAGAAAALAEAAHLLYGEAASSGANQRGYSNDSEDTNTVASPLPPMEMEDVMQLEHDLADQDAVEAGLHSSNGAAANAPHDEYSGDSQEYGSGAIHYDDGELAAFGHDADTDAQILAGLKGYTPRLQNTADTVETPLRVPDKSGHVTVTSADLSTAAGTTAAAAAASSDRTEFLPVPDLPPVRLVSSHSYLTQQDRLYLSYPTPAAAQLQPPASHPSPSADGTTTTTAPRQCILVVFSANDLRVHDNHLLALASVRARAARQSQRRSTDESHPDKVETSSTAGEEKTEQEETVDPVPVVAVCVLDYRTFAQPSVVGGFFRQSPQRAQFFLDTVAALRRKLEGELHVPLLVRCGRPEEHVPRLAAELGATDVFVTTQYAPHERRVQALMLRRLRSGVWVSREDVRATDPVVRAAKQTAEEMDENVVGEDDADGPLVAVVEHATARQHPYGPAALTSAPSGSPSAPPVVHSVWQTTLIHLDDLPTPLAAMKEGERWYHDDVTVSTIRPTEPYDAATQQLAQLPRTWQHQALLPSVEEAAGRAAPSVLRGALPSLEELGYAAAAVTGTDFAFEEVIATQSSHPAAGEDAALARLHDWLAEGGMTSLLRYGRDRRTNTKLYSQKLARVSPYIAVGALSPRRYYEVLRRYAHAHQRDGFVQQQFREAVLRLSRRDYWHWMGLRFGDRLFFSYGPHPAETDDVADWRHDRKVVQRWCTALTGIPFADAAMRELLGTGFVAHEGRQALAWLLTRGYGQDWRLGAEWMERCSLDYDPFVCYGNFAYLSGLLHDDFGEPVRTVHYLAHQHDQTGIYIKKWLPQLSKVPPVYIHRPHVLTPRMQAMHNVYLGKNYPYPLKLWQGAQRTLGGAELTSYYAAGIRRGPGYAEALRYGAAVLPPEEFSAAVTPAYVQRREWAAMLPASAFADVAEDMEEVVRAVKRPAATQTTTTTAGAMAALAGAA